MKLTDNEIKVIKAFKVNDIVSDYGWEHEDASTWVEGFYVEAGIDSISFPGVMASLSQKNLVYTNGESFGLTSMGREIAKTIEE